MYLIRTIVLVRAGFQLVQILWVISIAFGAAPEYMYPLYLLKFYGFYTFLGGDYGGVASVCIPILAPLLNFLSRS